MSRKNIWDFWSAYYDNLWVQRVSLAPTRAALLARLARLKPGRLLDMGCGTGQLLDDLKRTPAANAWNYIGVDHSAAMINCARRKHPEANLCCADIMTFAAPPDCYDTVICAHAFPYLPDQPAALARLAHWLKPGGKLLLAQAVRESVYDSLILAFVKLTVSAANYQSISGLCAMAHPLLRDPCEIVRINRNPIVPSLRLLVWTKPAEGVAA